MKYRLAIFDLDGTILNTLEDLTDSTNYALVENGFDKRTLQEVKRFVGNGIGRLIERAVPSGTSSDITKKVLQDFTEHYGIHCADKTKPYEGIQTLIEELREEGYLTAVVSNKADFAVQELCEQYFKGMFDYVVGEKENIRRKPSPDAVFDVLKRLGVELSKSVYIGDSEVDVQTAKNAGIDIISVSWGFRERQYLKEQGADVIVDSMSALKNLLME